METKQGIKPIFQREMLLNSRSAYQDFRKKGYRIIPKLTIQYRDTDETNLRNRKTLKKAKLLRVFRQIKFVKKLDLTDLMVSNGNFYHSSLLYIAKRVTFLSCLKTRDLREDADKYKDFLTSWPKYMKYLRSFQYNPVILGKSSSLFETEETNRRNIEKLKNVRLSTDYLKYLPKLELMQINFPWAFDKYSPDTRKLWKFEKYPASIKKIYFNLARLGGEIISTSIAHLKNLKDFKLLFTYYVSQEMINSGLNLLLQVTQLESLEINFGEGYLLDATADTALKALSKLKRIRLSFVSKQDNHKNLEILDSLKNCLLEDFGLKVQVLSDQSIPLITDFIAKQKNLKTLKISITKPEVFESLKEIENLVKTIDDLPQITVFSFLAKTLKLNVHKKQIYPEIDMSFEKLLSRSTSLKKFKITLNQHVLSQNGLMKILNSLKAVSPVLEKLRIDVGEYKPKGADGTDAIISFINGMKNVRSLKLVSVDVPSRSFFLEIIEAILGMKFLKCLSIGEVSGKVTKPSFMDGVERILSKRGLEKFICETSLEFKRSLLKKAAGCPRLEIAKIKKTNPYLKQWPSNPIFEAESDESSW